MGPSVNKRLQKRDKGEAEVNAPPKVLRKDHDAAHPVQNTRGGKSLAAIRVDAKPTFHIPATQDTPAIVQSVSEPDPLSDANPQQKTNQDIAESSQKATVAEDLDSERLASFTSMGGSPGSIYQPGWGVTNNCRLDTPEACQDMRIQAREKHIKNLEALLGAEADMKKAAKAKNAELAKELGDLHVTGEEKIKAAFEEFKKYKDDRVSLRYAEMDSRLDALSIDFDEELYLHMLMAIVGRQWVIGHGLHLAVMKCAKSIEL
ncbi:hypothetical protein Tco_1225559, partial [Tanacetum coccineum]